MSRSKLNENQNNNLQKTDKKRSLEKIVSLMKELAEIQYNNKILYTKIMAKTENYKNDRKRKDIILQEYEKVLDKIEKEYQDRVTYVLRQKERLETEEIRLSREKPWVGIYEREIKETHEYMEHCKKEEECLNEIEQAKQQGNLELVTIKKQEYEALKEQNPLTKYHKEIEETEKRREKIQEYIKKCDNILPECEKDRDNKMKMITEHRAKHLPIEKKQNLFQKIIGNAFKGGKKIANHVIGKVEETNYHVKEEMLPIFQEKVSNGIDKSIEVIKEEGTLMLETGKETLDKKKEKTIQFVENRKQDWYNAQKIKEQLIKSFENKVNKFLEKEKTENTEVPMIYDKIQEDSEEQK